MTGNVIQDRIEMWMNEAASSISDFHHLRLHVRLYANSVDTTWRLAIRPNAQGADGSIYNVGEPADNFSDEAIQDYLTSMIDLISTDLDVSVQLQIAPRVSIILRDSMKLDNCEIQFVNVSVDEVLSWFTEGIWTDAISRKYPGIEAVVLIRPKGYQEIEMPAPTVSPVASAKPKPDMQSAAVQDAIKAGIEEYFAQAVGTVQSVASGTQEILNDPAKREKVLSETLPNTEEDILRIIRERNGIRSPAREGDNEVQRLLREGKLGAAESPEILKVEEKEGMLPSVDATDENLFELFETAVAGEEETIPEPPTDDETTASDVTAEAAVEEIKTEE